MDDIEFRMDVKDEVVHVRSASRVGYSDFGVNRRRVGALRQRFSQECTFRGSWKQPMVIERIDKPSPSEYPKAGSEIAHYREQGVIGR
jgi:Protein of unknown function (DUF1499)